LTATELADPAHPAGGRVGVVAEFLRHPADTAATTELLHGAADGDGYHIGCMMSLLSRGKGPGGPAAAAFRP
jgi:hypothetical protein